MNENPKSSLGPHSHIMRVEIPYTVADVMRTVLQTMDSRLSGTHSTEKIDIKLYTCIYLLASLLNAFLVTPTIKYDCVIL
jgi:hypothetical protein